MLTNTAAYMTNIIFIIIALIVVDVVFKRNIFLSDKKCRIVYLTLCNLFNSHCSGVKPIMTLSGVALAPSP